jgi:hypothetical protein
VRKIGTECATVCIAGFAGGALCGSVIIILMLVASPPDISIGTLQFAAILGVIFGGPFGLIEFPICYYLFLRTLPLKMSLAVTIPATIIVGWFGIAYDGKYNALDAPYNLLWLLIYGPGFLGLLLSSIALRVLSPLLMGTNRSFVRDARW